jgi:hypothetical protein
LSIHGFRKATLTRIHRARSDLLCEPQVNAHAVRDLSLDRALCVFSEAMPPARTHADERAPSLRLCNRSPVTISPDIPPDVLASAAADPASPAWTAIWKASCHQGTCFPASALLLPWLAHTCAAFSPQEREKALTLAGFIAVDAADADRAMYAGEISALRALAAESLHHASSDSMFVYLQQAILGFDGDEIWGKELDHINDGEVDVQCPECEEDLLVDLEPADASIEPGLSSELAGRLHAEAAQANRDSVATALTNLFGRLSCPDCGTRFNVADHLSGILYR